MDAVKWFVNDRTNDIHPVPEHGVVKSVCSSCAEDLAAIAHALIEDSRWPITITLISEDGSHSLWTVECEYVPKYRARRYGS